MQNASYNILEVHVHLYNTGRFIAISPDWINNKPTSLKFIQTNYQN